MLFIPFDIRHSKKKLDWNFKTEKQSTEYLFKVRKCIESCQTELQLMKIRWFVQNYFYNMKYIGLQGFVAIDLMKQYEEKFKELTKSPNQ